MGILLRLATAPLTYPLKALLRTLPPSVSAPIAFETRSFVGRLLAQPLKLDSSRRNYLNLGSADDHFENYVALDFFSSSAGYGADLRYPLLIDTGVFDGIFTEHALEHLGYEEVAQVLTECLRILKPGGRIRIIVPDLSLFAENYAQRNDTWFHEWEQAVLEPRGRKMISNLQALSFVTQEYGHRSAWDMETMEKFLARAGFADIRRCAPNEGEDVCLLRDKLDRDRTMVSLYVEARKPPSVITGAQGSKEQT
jgi:predicted SAM-dependent methyltransferase